MKRNTKIVLTVAATTAVAALAFLRGCTRQSSETVIVELPSKPLEEKLLRPFILPASTKLEAPFSTYTIKAGRDTQLVFSSGTKLTIPACAFSTMDNETVTLRYREFHTKADLIGAGIPMTMNGSSDEFLETTGMFELRAYQGEEALSLGESCAVKVELANNEAGEKVNLYQLDESKRSWIEIARELPAKVYTSAKKEKTTKPKFDESKYRKEARKAGYFMPAKPRVANPKRYSFHFKINLQQFPELNIYDGILWEYAGNGGSDDPDNNKWVQSATWKEMHLYNTSKNDIYQLTLSTKDKTFTTLVRPAFEKEDMEYARDIFKDRYAKYRQYMDKKNAEEAAWLAKEAKEKKAEEKIDLITRSFEINKFGIWNCDRYYHISDPLQVALTFTAASKTLAVARVYVIEKNINSVIELPVEKNATSLKLKRGGKYELLLLDSEVKFHKISRKYFEQRLQQNPRMTLTIEDQGKEITSIKELNEII